jgi:hypothetical protein
MSLSTILAHGRAAAEQRMLDACTVEHPTGVTTDDLTGAVTPTMATIYTGPCRITMSGNGSPTDGGEVTVAVLSLQVHLPTDGTGDVVHGDLITVTAARNDPELVGRTLRVISKQLKSEATARRVDCEELD